MELILAPWKRVAAPCVAYTHNHKNFEWSKLGEYHWADEITPETGIITNTRMNLLKSNSEVKGKLVNRGRQIVYQQDLGLASLHDSNVQSRCCISSG
jgi:hypothetical protein